MRQIFRSRGFTLIELMIAVAVVAILAGIAYPSYQEHVRKSRRAAAQAVLLDVAARQQQYLLDRRSYAGTLAALRYTVPAEVSAYYQIATEAPAATPPTFTVRATPQGAQAADKCGWLQVDQTGAKTTQHAVGGCW